MSRGRFPPFQYNIVQLHAEESRLRQTLEAERAIRIDAETTKD